MRKDMDKVIVERPRSGGGVKFPRRARVWQRAGIEDRPRREGIERAWRYTKGRKFLNENLAPLRRLIESNVGRPWDKVYGEIAAHVSRDNAVQAHIWQHLEDYVAPHVDLVDGRPINRPSRRWYTPRESPFYVDPHNGLLRRNKHYRDGLRRPKPEPPQAYALGESRIAVALDGIWYEAEVKSLCGADINAFDVALKKRVAELDSNRLRETYGSAVYAVRKRQLNSREIARIVKPATPRPLPNIVR